MASDKIAQALRTVARGHRGLTRLSDHEESQFRAWANANGITDVDAAESRYDYRGFWKKYPNFRRRPGEHFTDEFKLPGHMSFSVESKYATPNNYGGRWVDGTDMYMPQLGTSRTPVVADQLGMSLLGLLTGEVNAPVPLEPLTAHRTLADLAGLSRKAAK